MSENVTGQQEQQVEEQQPERENGRDEPEQGEGARDAKWEELESELAETKDKLLRQAAEFQNYRRRTERDKGNLLKLGRAQVVEQMLDVLDDFRRSLEAAERVEEQQEAEPGPAYEALHEGVELVYQKFVDELEKLGVEPIDAVGEPFDEYLHEAMMQQPGPDDMPPGTVIDELQKGYRMGDRVLRHSKVIVSS